MLSGPEGEGWLKNLIPEGRSISQEAPAILTRNMDCPEIFAREEELPFLACSIHPATGTVSIAFMPRTCGCLLYTSFLSAVFGLPNQNWRDQAPAFPAIYTITNVWKGFGFGSILYISSITSIDQSQYESARIDGANRGQQCWYITLPGIKNIIAINLILAIGGILGTNSDLILLLYSPATYDVADVIGTYTYRPVSYTHLSCRKVRNKRACAG